MSVVSVPFESTGEGSTFWGYGLGGGARVSVGAEDLRVHIEQVFRSADAAQLVRLTSSQV